MESTLLDRIQQARLNPGKALAELGINAEDLAVCYPDLEPYLNGGLFELLQDERLFSAADKYAHEMVKEKHFSKISIDGSTPEERFQEFLYYSAAADETNGVLLFRNYLSKDVAVDALFRNIIENELKCENNNSSIVFNPVFKEIGLSIKSGSLDINGVKLNFYLAVVDLGADVVNPFEKKTLLDINFARVSENIIISEMPSLKFDMDLYLRAQKLAEETVGEITQSSDVDNLQFSSSKMSLTQVAKVWITKKSKTLDEVETYLLSAILEQDGMLFPSERVALNPDHTNTGISLQTVKSVFNENDMFYIHVMAIVSDAEPAPRELFNLSGVLYIDENEDGNYTSGEGYRSGFIIIKNETLEKMIITGSFGEFNIDGLAPGKYFLQNGDVQNQIGFVEQEFTITDNNIFQFLDCEGAVVEEKN